MAQTDTRPGFKLPWSAERNDPDQPTDEPSEESQVVDDPPVAEKVETADMTDATVTEETTSEAPASEAPAADATAAGAGRRSTKFMVDMSRAMQAAAEASRDEAMARLTGDAKAAIEEIRAGSVDEAAALRRRADDDVAAVREWSKGEIARIREAAEARIAARKSALDGEMDAYAAVVEARVERVTATVSSFETEMADFFERLLAENDPTRIAAMAETMPDAPDLAGVAATIAEPAVAAFDPIPIVIPGDDPRLAALATPVTEPEAEPEAEAQPEAQPEAVAETQPEAEAEAAPESGPEPEPEASPEATEQSTPDFAAAEAEAATFSGELDDDDGTASLSADRNEPPPTAAAPAPTSNERSANGQRVTTRVVVLGLVSVASIATFKRSLGRVQGVSAIGVASGPDGEFVFTVSHDSSLGLSDAITALPGFDAHVTSQSADGLEVAAHDPDSGD